MPALPPPTCSSACPARPCRKACRAGTPARLPTRRRRDYRAQLGRTAAFMWDYVGMCVPTVPRSAPSTGPAARARSTSSTVPSVSRDLIELRNPGAGRRTAIRSAMQRRESRGLHTLDYPEQRPKPAILSCAAHLRRLKRRRTRRRRWLSAPNASAGIQQPRMRQRPGRRTRSTISQGSARLSGAQLGNRLPAASGAPQLPAPQLVMAQPTEGPRAAQQYLAAAPPGTVGQADQRHGGFSQTGSAASRIDSSARAQCQARRQQDRRYPPAAFERFQPAGHGPGSSAPSAAGRRLPASRAA